MKKINPTTKNSILKATEPKKEIPKRGMFGIMKGKITINGKDEDVFNLN